jgi:hypothetical protein
MRLPSQAENGGVQPRGTAMGAHMSMAGGNVIRYDALR